MRCSRCGKEIPNDSVFCPECGAEQTTEEKTEENEKKIRCPKCGSEIPEDSVFCPECGNSVRENVLQKKIHPQKIIQQAVEQVSTISKKKVELKKRDKIIGAAAGIILLLCVVISGIMVTRKPTINLNDYMTVSIEGYDTVGQASAVFDSEKFQKKYEKKLRKVISKKHIESTYSSATEQFWSTCVSGTLSKDSGISNGDVITYTWSCNKERASSMYGFKLKYQDIEVKAKNLEEAQTFDPFDGIEVKFDGIAPNGYASIEGKAAQSAAREFNYILDNTDGLSNGDKVTVTAYLDADDPTAYCIQNYGMVPSELTKIYTVSGLKSYVKSISEISDSSLKEMQSQAEDVYHSDMARSWSEDETLVSLSYLGNYLLTSKKSNEDYWGSNNILYLVYKAQIKDTYSEDGKNYDKVSDIYWYVSYYDLVVDETGVTSVDVTNYDTPGHSVEVELSRNGSYADAWWYYDGYETLDTLYKSAVTAKLESYNHEDNVDEKLANTTESINTEQESKNKSAQESEDGMIFPDSSETEINSEDIKKLSDQDLRYAVNEIYARHGYIFKDESLRTYYEQYDWYKETVKPEDFSSSVFNDIEMRNVENLQAERDARGN